MVALRPELGDLGRALPVHQGRGRCRRAARISRMVTGRPGRRRWAGRAPLGAVGARLAPWTVARLPAVFLSPRPARPPSALWAIAVLGVVCTALGLVVFFRLIAEAGPSRASVITYINPLVAVLLGVVVLDEHLGPTSLAGLVLILGGSWLSAGGPSPLHSENGK